MAQIRIRFLVPRTNKAGITSWYWQPSSTLARAGWKAIALGKDEGQAITAARIRNEEVDRWQSGAASPRNVRDKTDTGTVGALIDRYRREIMDGIKPSGAPRLKPKTRESYEICLKRLQAWAGKQPIAFVTPARVRALRDATVKPVEQGGLGHAAAFNLLAQGRQLFAFAERIDLTARGSNPFASFDLAKVPPRRAIWTAEDEAAFIASAYELGRPSMALAMELALYTAQREGDLLAFTEPQLQVLEIFDQRLHDLLAGDDGKVMGWVLEQAKMTTEYSVRAMQIPLEPTIRSKVDRAIRANRARDRAASPPRLISHVLVDDKTGLPWKQRHFISKWTEVRNHAAERTGRPHMARLVWHDLRRTRVVRLRRRGMPKEMIAAITGHDPKSIDEMLKIYGPIDPTITAAAIAGTIEPKVTSLQTTGATENERFS